MTIPTSVGEFSILYARPLSASLWNQTGVPRPVFRQLCQSITFLFGEESKPLFTLVFHEPLGDAK